jgi:hypothetical protein
MVKPLDLELLKPMTIHIPFEPRPGTDSGFVIARQGSHLKTNTRPTLNLLLLLRACARRVIENIHSTDDE